MERYVNKFLKCSGYA